MAAGAAPEEAGFSSGKLRREEGGRRSEGSARGCGGVGTWPALGTRRSPVLREGRPSWCAVSRAARIFILRRACVLGTVPG